MQKDITFDSFLHVSNMLKTEAPPKQNFGVHQRIQMQNEKNYFLN